MQKLTCDSCGRDLENDRRTAMLTFRIEHNSEENVGEHSKKLRRIYPELKEDKDYHICSVCVLKIFGVKFEVENI